MDPLNVGGQSPHRINAAFQSIGSREAGDIHHDPWLIPASEPLQALASSIFQRIEDNSPQKTRQRTDATERRKAIVENIVASLALMVLYHPEGTRMALSAKNAATTRYDRPKFPRDVVMVLVTRMEELGVLTRRKGTRGQHRTTIEPTESFRAALLADTEAPSLGRAPGAETIILKANMRRGKPKALVDYQDTPETHAMREEMDAVNVSLARADLRLSGRIQPPPFLTRRFQIDALDAAHTFDRHGRLYGGFWLSLPKTQRHLIRLNGEEVVDLDFRGMFSQLAYLEAGLALPNSDPYEGIEGLPRTAAKLGLSALLCRTGPMERLPSEMREVLPRHWTGRRLQTAMAERHPGIAHLFGTGVGLRLMFTESRILVATLLRLVDQGIPALPMHDGLMVPARSEDAAKVAMARASMEVVGTVLPVVRKEIPGPDGGQLRDNSPPME